MTIFKLITFLMPLFVLSFGGKGGPSRSDKAKQAKREAEISRRETEADARTLELDKRINAKRRNNSARQRGGRRLLEFQDQTTKKTKLGVSTNA